jgi:NADH-quinone oxidoreductase subunit G
MGGRSVAALLSNRMKVEAKASEKPQGIQRIADVPMYFTDPLVRRSPPLQKTRDARPPRAWMNSRLLAKLGVAAGQPVLANGAVKLMAALDDRLPEDCVRIAAGHPSTAPIGPMFGEVMLARVAAERAA